MRNAIAIGDLRHRAVRKARIGLIVVVAAGVAVSFWLWFFRNLGRRMDEVREPS